MGAEFLYVSWGGTGRAASVRKALRRAMAEERSLRYLAVLDDEHFADLDEAMLEIVSGELHWLLDAQLELTKSQVGAEDLDVPISVAAGQVVDVVAASVGDAATTHVLIGAPVPVVEHQSIDELVAQIARRTGAQVELLRPDAT